MKKLTKQLLTGVIAIGLLAPVATSSVNPVQTTVSAKHHYRRTKRAKRNPKLYMKNAHIKPLKIPNWLKGYWIKYGHKTLYANRYTGTLRVYKAYNHGHVMNYLIAPEFNHKNHNIIKYHGHYALVHKPDGIKHIYHIGKNHIWVSSNYKRNTKMSRMTNGTFHKVSYRHLMNLTYHLHYLGNTNSYD